ncbi:MAG TPA: 30S ribosome-binding factor RbfA [Burkholderiales bacterium]|jgi:ribosome-binding factor A
MRHQTKGFSRSERVNEQIRRDLAEIIRTELKDPRIGMISLTGVEVTADYAHATVFFTTMTDRSAVPSILAGLKKSGGFLRVQLGKRIKIHQIPELHFKFDESLERGIELSQLIEQANSVRAKED